jgi:N-acetylglutamate synthase-like GNAT family acetyltransferase
VIEIDQIAVRVVDQRSGVGQLLVDTVRSWARELEVVELQLIVLDFNQTAMAFFRSLGFGSLQHRMQMPVVELAPAPWFGAEALPQ